MGTVAACGGVVTFCGTVRDHSAGYRGVAMDYRIGQAAEILGVSADTVRRWGPYRLTRYLHSETSQLLAADGPRPLAPTVVLILPASAQRPSRQPMA
jgi:molybdopterin synthase catalytic subunit